MDLARAITWRRHAAVAVLLLVVGGLSAVGPPADAAAPWRFTTRAATESVAAGATEAAVVTCPEGYMAIGGGLSNVTHGGSGFEFEIVAAYRHAGDPRTYQVTVHNYDSQAQQATTTVVCALASHVGSLAYVTATSVRNATTGMAWAVAQCAAGQKALLGGADWSAGAGATRRIDFQGPIFQVGWYASGFATTTGAVLTVEAYCIPEAALGDAHFLQEDTTYTSQNSAVTSQLTCTAGRRPGAGGIQGYAAAGGPAENHFRGNDWLSAPAVNEPAWKMTTAVEANVMLRRTLWCLPASQPTISFTQTPSNPTNSSDATFAFTASDPSGETLGSITCAIDGSGTGCSPAGTVLSGLAPGPHTFSVSAKNESFQTTTQTYNWTIDQTPPEVVTPIASPPLAGPIVVEFSELVSDVADGLTITQAGKSTPLAGSWTVISQLAGDTTARFTPAKPLTPGRRYDVSATSVIKDLAGNALVPNTEQVRTVLVVQNTSPVLVEQWDRDTNASASGGGFIESSAANSRATWNVTTEAGQQVGVLGVRRPNGGYATIYVDGVKAKRASFYKATTALPVAVFQTDPLTAGEHTISVKVDGTKPTGSTGTWVGLDALAIGDSRTQETKATQRFRRVTDSAASGGSYDTVMHRTTGDTGGRPTYQLRFDGVGINGYATKTPASGSTDLYIDGTKVATFSLHSSTVQSGVLAFRVGGLSAGPHTLRLTPVGTASGSQSSVGLDRLVVK